MNERYLFRGKRIDDGDWVIGFYYSFPPLFRIRYWIDLFKKYGDADIIPETIGKCTGLKDKNGVLIFEGDIVNLHQFLFDGGEYENELIGQVQYDKNQCAFCLKNIRHDDIKKYMGYDNNEDIGLIAMFNFYGLHEESWEVIGNIHDNPELLKGGGGA